jgi:hypothetical protein
MDEKVIRLGFPWLLSCVWRIATRADITGKSRREREIVKRSEPRNALQPRAQTPHDFIPVFAGLTGYHSELEYLKS